MEKSNEGYRYVRKDGTVETAPDLETAHRMCPVLGKMSLEMAGILAEVAKIGSDKMEADSQTSNDESLDQEELDFSFDLGFKPVDIYEEMMKSDTIEDVANTDVEVEKTLFEINVENAARKNEPDDKVKPELPSPEPDLEEVQKSGETEAESAEVRRFAFTKAPEVLSKEKQTNKADTSTVTRTDTFTIPKLTTFENAVSEEETENSVKDESAAKPELVRPEAEKPDNTVFTIPNEIIHDTIASKVEISGFTEPIITTRGDVATETIIEVSKPVEVVTVEKRVDSLRETSTLAPQRAEVLEMPAREQATGALNQSSETNLDKTSDQIIEMKSPTAIIIPVEAKVPVPIQRVEAIAPVTVAEIPKEMKTSPLPILSEGAGIESPTDIVEKITPDTVEEAELLTNDIPKDKPIEQKIVVRTVQNIDVPKMVEEEPEDTVIQQQKGYGSHATLSSPTARSKAKRLIGIFATMLHIEYTPA